MNYNIQASRGRFFFLFGDKVLGSPWPRQYTVDRNYLLLLFEQFPEQIWKHPENNNKSLIKSQWSGNWFEVKFLHPRNSSRSIIIWIKIPFTFLFSILCRQKEGRLVIAVLIGLVDWEWDKNKKSGEGDFELSKLNRLATCPSNNASINLPGHLSSRHQFSNHLEIRFMRQ